MAQKVQVLLVDDLDGGEAEETVSFALDGTSYEIDLSSPNAKRLREELAPFVEAARRIPTRRGASRGKQRTVLSRERSAQIRAWAQEQGKSISERGRIPKSIVEEYEAAHG
ncbi:Lsr2 family protein [Thermobifida halotolerans]|uniref:Lsr2 family protein n=1 Tax=Thermobifida halotolerans TaxID=483545 RepID=A0A399G1L5_9ACTN|nr:Lsr2 family protein [Thermobifida halotolerans]UOE18698.1 Lsr2 family protein [Thermobifida halotolerans]